MSKLKPVSGVVTYDVLVVCPHCGKHLALNQFPYSVDGEYSHEEDLLGMVLFGDLLTPAEWNSFEIEYKCCGCKRPFVLTSMEIKGAMKK